MWEVLQKLHMLLFIFLPLLIINNRIIKFALRKERSYVFPFSIFKLNHSIDRFCKMLCDWLFHLLTLDLRVNFYWNLLFKSIVNFYLNLAFWRIQLKTYLINFLLSLTSEKISYGIYPHCYILKIYDRVTTPVGVNIGWPRQ